MADLSAKQLFQQAVAAIKRQDIEAGRKLIQASIRKDPTDEMAWLVYASIAENQRNKLVCLKKVLELNPKNTNAHKMLLDMGVDPKRVMAAQPTQSPAPSKPEPAPPPPTPEPVTDDAADWDDLDALADEFDDGDTLDDDLDALADEFDDGDTLDDDLDALEPEPVKPKDVPIPKPPPRPASFNERLHISTHDAIQITRTYLDSRHEIEGVEWVKKDANRAGENEMAIVRAAAFTGIGISVVIPLIFISSIVFASGVLQQDTRVNYLIEPTKTATPLTTPTPSPGFTPTDTPTPTLIPDGLVGPSTPTPSSTPSFRAGYIDDIVPTDVVLPGVAGRAAQDSALLVVQGEYDTAIATLQADRESSGEQSFNGNIYYVEALALMNKGEYEDALSLLEEGDERRIRIAPANTAYEASIQAGIAAVRVARARNEVARGNPAGAAQQVGVAEPAARRAITLEQQWAEPYLSLIEGYRLTGRYSEALTLIDEARAQNELELDVRFLVEQGEIHYLQSNYDEAAHAAFLALHAEPNNGPAHDLRTRVALLGDDMATASIYAQTYIFYHPNKVNGWQMLGEVRRREGSVPLALLAYSEAIARGEYTDEPPAIDAYIGRADIYEGRGQYTLAFADISSAIEALGEGADIEALAERQLRLGVAAGAYDEVQTLAATYAEADVLSVGPTNLAIAHAIAAQETLVANDYEQLVTRIQQGISSLSIEQQAEANTLLALGQYGIGELDTALATINSAISAGGETAQRRLIRAQILEEQAEFASAVMDYDRVLTLDQLVAVAEPVRVEALEGRERAENGAAEAIAAATATANAP